MRKAFTDVMLELCGFEALERKKFSLFAIHGIFFLFHQFCNFIEQFVRK